MNPAEVHQLLEKHGAIGSGHFLLSSGRHSDTYVEKQRVLEHPRIAASLAEAIVRRFDERFTVVVSPAVGAIVLGALAAYAAHTRFVFAERIDDRMVLRRGQALGRTDRVLVVEDVITTGGSAAEVIALAEAERAHVVGVGALADRSQAPPAFRLEALVRIETRDWDPGACPLCRAGDALTAPGSRHVATERG